MFPLLIYFLFKKDLFDDVYYFMPWVYKDKKKWHLPQVAYTLGKSVMETS